jgi:mRNA-degrading endonuclease RelE of RelBE toxin-antitoxin system
MKVLQSNLFEKTVKKLHSVEKELLNNAIKQLMLNPELGDLTAVRVYKFKVHSQQMLLAYRYNENELILMLLAYGSHENFYRDLKKSL